MLYFSIILVKTKKIFNLEIHVNSRLKKYKRPSKHPHPWSVPACGHDSRAFGNGRKSAVTNARVRNEIFAKNERSTMFDKIRKSLNFKSPLLRIKKSQLRWFGQVSRMPLERFSNQILYA